MGGGGEQEDWAARAHLSEGSLNAELGCQGPGCLGLWSVSCPGCRCGPAWGHGSHSPSSSL